VSPLGGTFLLKQREKLGAWRIFPERSLALSHSFSQLAALSKWERRNGRFFVIREDRRKRQSSIADAVLSPSYHYYVTRRGAEYDIYDSEHRPERWWLRRLSEKVVGKARGPNSARAACSRRPERRASAPETVSSIRSGSERARTR